MTPKPSEAELALGEASATITRALAKLLDASYYEPGHGPADEVCDIWRAAAADANRARDVLLARIRELTEDVAKLKRDEGAIIRQVDYQHTRAEAAEKRVAELEAELGVARVQWGYWEARAVEQIAKLAALRATPAAAVREALVYCRDELKSIPQAPSTSDRARYLTAIAKADKALAGAEAGERKPVCSTCNDTHNMTLHDREVMCTRCPVPCERCRRRPQGPFCAVTPCPCACHVKGTP